MFLLPEQRGWYCFLVASCDFVCLSDVCQHDNSFAVRDIIAEFSGHHPMVEWADKFENGYIAVRVW